MDLQEQPKPGFFHRHLKSIAASIALTIGFVWVMKAGALPFVPPAGALARVDTALVVGFAVAMLVSMLTKYLRYHFLLAPITRLPLRRLLSISSIGMALVTLLPFRLGEFARPAMLRQKGKVSGWAVTGTVGAERIIDGVAFGLTLLLGLAFAPPRSPLPDRIGNLGVPAALVPRAAVAATSAFGVALVVMAAFFWWRSLARRLTERVIGIFSKKLGARVADIVSNMSDGFKFLPNLRYTVPYLLVTLVSIISHIWAIAWLAQAVGISTLTFAQASVVVGVLALGFALPNAPGFFGAVQLALYAGLALYVTPEEVISSGATLAFLFYVTYLGIVILMAMLALVANYVVPEREAESEPEPV
jgi:hypothetical protein